MLIRTMSEANPRWGVPRIHGELLNVGVNVCHVAVTDHPSAAWTVQQLREAFRWDQAPRFLVRDRDYAFDGWAETAKAMSIDQILTAPRLSWQNAFVERFIGSVATRMPRSRHRVQRHRPPASDESLLRVLRAFAHASLAREGHTDSSPNRAAQRGPRRWNPAGRRPSLPIRTPRRLT